MLTISPQMAFQAIVVLLFLFTGSCARLPDYAQPHLQQKAEPLPLNVITYRDLTKADFQAKELPLHLQNHQKRLSAHTAVSIRPVQNSKSIISSALIYNQQVYCGRIEQLSFEAVMIPGDSWWNPRMKKGREGYVLQHEQIHFALMEIAARQLTDRVARENGALTVFDSSYEAVKKKLMDRLNELMTEFRTNVLKEHTAFDEETSMRYTPKDQQRWWKRVTSQLQNLADRN